MEWVDVGNDWYVHVWPESIVREILELPAVIMTYKPNGLAIVTRSFYYGNCFCPKQPLAWDRTRVYSLDRTFCNNCLREVK